MSINATFFAQMVVFFLLVLFTMRFVWPPMARALDERAQRIAEGLDAADRAKLELSAVHKQVAEEQAIARKELSARIADAERRAQIILEEAKSRAAAESQRVMETARLEAEQQVAKARELLREQVAVLAVKGAEQILQREIDASVHAELLTRLQKEL
ncbi:F0F1 ATP synthase subunit B [Candidatus Symbiobacter mobilis]|uniref:ATP synthase subunit b n=1 Tax=Candidatus Symbiobacter mobilis CR TaxID=946483 RepID=U5N902_9BURK|nr:F0F1 ATP synthase subunit B [Candidatus Symbiobacter mobilis]AGX87842.1 F-type proton-transporting ATPase subunit b [Candidatus Symbiobacter mobilis CR]